MSAPNLADHRLVLPTHRDEQVFPRPLSWNTHHTAIWLGLIPADTDHKDPKARYAQRAVRDMIRRGELVGWYTGNAWFVSAASIVDLLEGRTGRSSQVAS